MRTLIILLILSYSTILISQNVIPVLGGSFEFEREYDKRETKNLTFGNWFDCGLILFPRETLIDVFSNSGFKKWEITHRASHGENFIVMVVRENNTFESFSQKLKNPLIKGKCYKISMDLAKSKIMKSGTARNPDLKLDYIDPVVLIIRGANSACQEGEFLAISKPIINNGWEKYEFTLEVTEMDITHLIIEAGYIKEDSTPYNGHVLLDNISDITEKDCNF